jgi:hypothetical protein
MLTPSFVALFNDTYVSAITDLSGATLAQTPIDPDVTDHGLIAELAFFVAMIAHEAGKPYETVIADESLRDQAEARAMGTLRSVLQPLSHGKVASDTDWAQVRKLCYPYQCFLQANLADTIQFTPEIPGSGFLDRCKADISVGRTLYEIKTVTRNFSAHDLRQLFIYLALQRATGQPRWDRGGLMNPRRATVAEFSVDYLLFKLSGGLTTGEVLDKIILFLSERSLVRDTQF